MTTIQYIGYNASHPADFVYHIPDGFEPWLLVLTHTPAEFWVNGEFREYPAHCAILYPPHRNILYRACRDTYVNDWVRFDSVESYVTETTFPLGIPVQLPDPTYCHHLFQLLTTEHFFNNIYHDLSIDHLLHVLFNKLAEASQSGENTPHFQNLMDLRKQIHNNPGFDWTVSAMAEYTHLSPGYLQALYKSTFGISCMHDVIQCRIRFAKENLIQGTQRIADIAVRCGYNNIEHFTRQFKKLTGYTPKEFRSMATKNNSSS